MEGCPSSNIFAWHSQAGTCSDRRVYLRLGVGLGGQEWIFFTIMNSGVFLFPKEPCIRPPPPPPCCQPLFHSLHPSLSLPPCERANCEEVWLSSICPNTAHFLSSRASELHKARTTLFCPCLGIEAFFCMRHCEKTGSEAVKGVAYLKQQQQKKDVILHTSWKVQPVKKIWVLSLVSHTASQAWPKLMTAWF